MPEPTDRLAGRGQAGRGWWAVTYGGGREVFGEVPTVLSGGTTFRATRALRVAGLAFALALSGCGGEATPEPTATPETIPPTPTTVRPPTPTSTPIVTANEHIVQPGDTLYDLALKYEVTVEEIVEANQLADPNVIKPGQRLKIPRN